MFFKSFFAALMGPCRSTYFVHLRMVQLGFYMHTMIAPKILLFLLFTTIYVESFECFLSWRLLSSFNFLPFLLRKVLLFHVCNLNVVIPKIISYDALHLSLNYYLAYYDFFSCDQARHQQAMAAVRVIYLQLLQQIDRCNSTPLDRENAECLLLRLGGSICHMHQVLTFIKGSPHFSQNEVNDIRNLAREL